MKKFIYTDIDGVLSLGSEIKFKSTKWGNIPRFNEKAVKVYNDILEKTGIVPIISSDWKYHFTLEQLQEIFIEFAGINVAPIGVTPTLPGATIQNLEEHRCREIMEHVLIHKPDVWVAIDDLKLTPWMPENYFIHLPRFMEGIKQSGKKEETIRKLMI